MTLSWEITHDLVYKPSLKTHSIVQPNCGSKQRLKKSIIRRWLDITASEKKTNRARVSIPVFLVLKKYMHPPLTMKCMKKVIARGKESKERLIHLSITIIRENPLLSSAKKEEI